MITAGVLKALECVGAISRWSSRFTIQTTLHKCTLHGKNWQPSKDVENRRMLNGTDAPPISPELGMASTAAPPTTPTTRQATENAGSLQQMPSTLLGPMYSDQKSDECHHLIKRLRRARSNTSITLLRALSYSCPHCSMDKSTAPATRIASSGRCCPRHLRSIFSPQKSPRG